VTVTKLSDLTEQIQKVWAPLISGQLRADQLLAQFCNRDYDGEIRQGNDTVYVSQVVDPTAEERTIGTDADVFGTQKASVTRIAIVADKRAVVGYEFEDLISIQTKLADADFRAGMVQALGDVINTRLYANVSPSTSSPDHQVGSVTSLDADGLADVRVLAGEAKWPKDGNWYGLISPQYWGTLMKDNDLKSSDFVQDQPTVNGQSARRLFGFAAYEDNSRTGKTATFFHKNFLHLVMQREIQFKISDLHSQKKFGYILTADVIYGVKQGINHSKLCVQVTS
jgi:hypothetical protein